MLNNLREIANHYHMSEEDYELGCGILFSGGYRQADVVIAPEGKPYLYRWHVIPRSDRGNVYFHIQVADDPMRPLHDHPWDNQSVILAGGYDELYWADPPDDHLPLPAWCPMKSRIGAVVTRPARDAHRLLMPEGVPYTMTLFSTGPKVRRWGFWYPEGWVDASEVCHLDGNISIHIGKDKE